MNKKCSLILIALLLVFNHIAFAQQDGEIKEKVGTLKKIKLIEKLQLSEDVSIKFFARYYEHERKIDEVRSSVKQAVKELDIAIKEGKSGDYSSKIETLFKKESQLHSLMIEKVKSMKSLLTDEQYARFVIFEHKFLADLKKEITKRKKDK